MALKNKGEILRVNGLGRVARMRERRGAHKVFVGKPEVNRRIGTPGHKWVDCSKVELQ